MQVIALMEHTPRMPQKSVHRAHQDVHCVITLQHVHNVPLYTFSMNSNASLLALPALSRRIPYASNVLRLVLPALPLPLIAFLVKAPKFFTKINA